MDGRRQTSARRQSSNGTSTSSKPSSCRAKARSVEKTPSLLTASQREAPTGAGHSTGTTRKATKNVAPHRDTKNRQARSGTRKNRHVGTQDATTEWDLETKRRDCTHGTCACACAESQSCMCRLHVLCCAALRYATRRSASRVPHSIHFISFHFISFHFISFHFISFHFISFHFISFHFISFHFISFHFISFHFISFHFISFHFNSIQFNSIQFIYLLGLRAKGATSACPVSAGNARVCTVVLRALSVCAVVHVASFSRVGFRRFAEAGRMPHANPEGRHVPFTSV